LTGSVSERSEQPAERTEQCLHDDNATLPPASCLLPADQPTPQPERAPVKVTWHPDEQFIQTSMF
jgi:hypothetical protein